MTFTFNTEDTMLSPWEILTSFFFFFRPVTSLLYVSIHLFILENSDSGSRYWYQQSLTFFLALSFGDSKTNVFTNNNFFKGFIYFYFGCAVPSFAT